jgi:hypothetical protein
VEDLDVLVLCCPLAMTNLRYQQLKAYDNHYRVNSCSIVGMVSYDSEVASIFNQQQMRVHDEDVAIHCVGVLKNIYLLNYGPISNPIILMQCEWVWNGIDIRGNLNYRQDEAKILLANFRYIMANHEEPFIFPSQAQQVFFNG